MKALIILCLTLYTFCFKSHADDTNLKLPNNSQVDIMTIPEGKGTITGEMAKFYLAVGVSELYHCYKSKDPTFCTTYFESLKSPVGHMGFALFSITAKSVTKKMATITHRPLPRRIGAHLGLAAGIMMQEFFMDFYYNKNTQELLSLMSSPPSPDRGVKIKATLKRMWKNVLNSPDYLLDKIPLMSVIGAAIISPISIHAAEKVLSPGVKSIMFVTEKTGRKGRLLVQYGNNLSKTIKAGKAGFRYVWNGSKFLRVNPVVMLGSYVIETVVFLKWAELIEEPISHAWEESRAIKKYQQNYTRLIRALAKDSSEESTKQVKVALKNFQKSWEKFRSAQTKKLFTRQNRHFQALSKVEAEFVKSNELYSWFSYGLQDENTFHEQLKISHNLRNDIKMNIFIYDAIEKFFCSTPLDQNVDVKTSKMGIPVSFFRFDFNEKSKMPVLDLKVKQFKVINLLGTCDDDIITIEKNMNSRQYDKVICPVDSKDGHAFLQQNYNYSRLQCHVIQGKFRYQILKSGKYPHLGDIRNLLVERTDHNLGKVLQIVEQAKYNISRDYKVQAIPDALEILTGKIYEKRGDTFENTHKDSPSSTYVNLGQEEIELNRRIVESFKDESNLYIKLKELYPQHKILLRSAYEATMKKYQATSNLARYFSELDSDWEKDFFEQYNDADWVEIVKMYNSLAF